MTAANFAEGGPMWPMYAFLGFGGVLFAIAVGLRVIDKRACRFANDTDQED